MRKFHIVAHPRHKGGMRIDDANPEDASALNFVLKLHSKVIPSFQLVDGENGNAAVNIHRKSDQIFDDVTILDDWINPMPQEYKQSMLPEVFVRFHSLLQSELRADDLNAALSGTGDDAWNRYRTAQLEVLNSLQQTSEKVLSESAKEIAALRSAEERKNEELRVQLKTQFEADQKRLATEHEARKKSLDEREQELKKQFAEYETRQARFVARKETRDQINQLKDWLEDSSLTRATVRKRIPVFCGYILGIVATGVLTGVFTYSNYQLLKSLGPKVIEVPWWQWVVMTLKSVVPLAGFTTFLIYFIKWEGAWAKQHSEEELRTRARVIDVGRSAWLLEAVRDSHDAPGGKDLPPELLKELSRNLFSNSLSTDADDHHPQALSDMMLQQLSSLRIKSPEGAEIEATRNAGKSEKGKR